MVLCAIATTCPGCLWHPAKPWRCTVICKAMVGKRRCQAACLKGKPYCLFHTTPGRAGNGLRAGTWYTKQRGHVSRKGHRR